LKVLALSLNSETHITGGFLNLADSNSQDAIGMLRPFFMEDLLETWRTKAKYNLGESGHRARSLDDVLRCAGYEPSRFLEFVLGPTVLRDSSNRGSFRLREMIARLHPGATPENVLVTTGTSEALFLYFHVNRFSKVALLVPAFQGLYEVPRSLGAQIVGLSVAFNEEGVPQKNWELWEEILKKERPECLVFNHPHNPSGLVFDLPELQRLKNLCENLNIKILGDEHYRFLSTPDLGMGPTLYAQNDVNTAITGSFIKCTGTPGLRIGWCVGPTHLIEKMRSLKDYTTHTVCPLVEKVSEVILQNPECELFRKVHGEWIKNKETLSRWLFQNNQKWKGCAPQGGLVCCLFPVGYQTERQDFDSLASQLLEKGIFMLPLSTMEYPWNAEGKKHEDWNFGFRLGLGADPDLFSLALNVME
jgi:aspartate/methionine/tyrosine aminotransferase